MSTHAVGAAIPVLGIPHFNRPDLTLRLLHSIDFPVKQVVLIDQSVLPENELDNERFADAFGEEVWIIRHPNAGVAGAWNEIIKLFPAPYWMIANNDIQFTPHDLRRMHESVEHHVGAYECPTCRATFTAQELYEAKWNGRCIKCSPTGARDGEAGLRLLRINPGILYGNHGASWFSITEHGVETAGLFDENIYPAYLEDCDMAYRCDLLGLRRMDVAGVSAIHGDGELKGSCTIHSDPVIREKNGQTHGRNHDYYRAKWGHDNGKEIFKTPFNDPLWPVWAWKFNSNFRRRQQW